MTTALLIKIKRAILIPLSVVAICSNGCHRSPSSDKSLQSASDFSNQGLKDLESRSGISLPANSVLLSADDGGGREASHQFYEWVVFSPNPVGLPRIETPGVGDYVNLPVDDTVKFVQTRLKDRKLTHANLAIHSSWRRNSLGFSATLVRTVSGDYVIFNQGRVK